MNYSDQEITSRLYSHDPDDRRVAAVMIGKARHHDYVDDLVHLLRSDLSADVRSMAAFGLDLLGSVDAIPDLIEALYDSSFDVRSNSGWALVHMAKRILPQLIIPDVVDVLCNDLHPHAQQMAALILYNIPDDDARIALDTYWDK